LKVAKFLFVGLFGALCGCSLLKVNTVPVALQVAKSAEQAVEICGKGNVKSVTTDSFACKNSAKN
jgi:hypothetical protein